ncbi:MAG TPA: alpha-galactosidase [Microbacterium sp.]|nr:alpha-galactosidase [Microbacterium sp.]
MTLRKTPTPPMGWNSWDCFGTTVTEDEVLANARFMAEHLLPYGWDTIVIDADWADPGARSHGYNERAELVIDEYGRLQPDPGRFPSAAGGAGFGPLAEKIHALGLKFGFHVMRGIPDVAVRADTPVLGTALTASQIADQSNRCEWNPHYAGLTAEGVQAYYDSCLALYAEWGIDFIKADDMLWPYQSADIEAYSRAIELAPREIALSLSPGRHMSLAHLEHLRDNATMWRVSDDIWDSWSDIEPNFARLARWAPHASANGWPDGDMLPLGRIGVRAERGEPREARFTLAERRSIVTLWSMARSPLMIGGHLPESDPETIALFQNADVLAIGSSSHGNRELLRDRGLVIWAAEGPRGERWAAVFNARDESADETLDTSWLGFGSAPGSIVDVWTGAEVATEIAREQSHDVYSVAPGSSAVRLPLEPHGCVLLRA